MTNPKRVAHVTTAHPHTDNRILRKECAALASAGLDVWLVAVAPQDETRHGVSISALQHQRGRLRRMVLGPVDAWRALRQIKPAMIHVHDPELVPLAILWRLIHHRPAVFDAHEDLAKQVAGKPYLPEALRPAIGRLAALVEWAADRWLDGIVAATPAIGRNFTCAPVTLVQNFPWLSEFPTPAPAASGGPLKLCYVGAISKERGGLEMIEGVRRSSRLPELILAGAATPDMVEAMGADDSGQVKYLGLLPVDDIPPLIAGADAGLVILHPIPNYVDSQPTKLFEYMASGRPFIASDFSAWRKLLDTYDCGFFVDPFDADGLGEIINQIGQSPAVAQAMGSRGRDALVGNFTFEREAGLLVAMTRDLLAA